MIVEKVVLAIAKATADVAWKSANKSAKVGIILRKVGLLSKTPPEDFDSLYAFTLVHHGVERPRAVLDFFCHEDIKNGFREAFGRADPAVFSEAAQWFTTWNRVGDALREAGISPESEGQEFLELFHQMVDKSRKPAEVRRDQVLIRIEDKLQRGINLSWPIVGLDDELRSWFRTLGYRFEDYRVKDADHFEWIINVDARRGYDRILVYGVEGEGTVNHVRQLRAAANTQQTKEGWLVSWRRISSAARKEVKKSENENFLFCYTLDELIDEDADFSGYFEWLDREIKDRHIDSKFIPLACIKDDIEPRTKSVVSRSRYDDTETYIDRWLDDPSKQHISVLGEFGTGKSWLVLHYAWIALHRYKEAKQKGTKRPRIPIVIPLRDYAKAVSVESLFSEFFFRKHEIDLRGYSVFEWLNRTGRLLLLFDGFDEMAARVDRQSMINNFWELAKAAVPGAKLVLTCRTEHFPEARDGRALLAAELQSSTSALTGQPPQFEVIELEKFANEQIKLILEGETSADMITRIMANDPLLDLARRPVMIDLIISALPDIEEGRPIDISRIYLYAIRNKMERDIKSERTFTSLADKVFFLCELSWEMLATDKLSLHYKAFPDRIRVWFGRRVDDIELDHWHHDMLTQTMLIRDAAGNYSPAHRSLVEFFVAFKLAALVGILASDFCAAAQADAAAAIDGSAPPKDYTWTDYFSRTFDAQGSPIRRARLQKFVVEIWDRLITTAGAIRVTPAVIALLRQMIAEPRDVNALNAIGLIAQARERGTDASTLARNVVELVACAEQTALVGTDLSRLDLAGVDLSYSNLSNADLHGSVLIGASLVGTALVGANLRNCRLELIKLFAGQVTNVGDDIVFSYQDDKLFISGGPNGGKSWRQMLPSRFIASWALTDTEIHLLPLRGPAMAFERKTGRRRSADESRLRTWRNADVSGASGLQERKSYVLGLLGAVNLPPYRHDMPEFLPWEIEVNA